MTRGIIFPRKNKSRIFSRFINLFLLNALIFSFFPFLEAKAAGASLYLAPSSGTYAIGGAFSVSVRVNTGGDPINAAEGSISYDADLLEVSGVSKGGSVFTLWTTEPAARGGSISFGGGIPHPGYKGAGGQIFTINFKAKKAGTAKVRFTSGAVLANDGKGTNILASMGSGSYVINPKTASPDKPADKPAAAQTPTPPKEEIKIDPEYNKPVIFSNTHPEQNRWYNKTKAVFGWKLPDGVSAVSFAFDQDPKTEPNTQSDGLMSEKEFDISKDGNWYFHLKFKDSKRWGTTAHYRIMSDTRPPKPFEAGIRYLEVGEWPELLFETEDADSGMERYDISIGSLEEKTHTVGPEVKTFIAGDLEVGEHTAVIKAVDKAGNETYSTVKFKIEPIPAPEIHNYPSEIKPSDNFYMQGTAIKNGQMTVFMEWPDGRVSTSSAHSDSGGNWFYLDKSELPKGRYVAWATVKNDKGIGSLPSKKISFLVAPPVFAIIGNFVLNYFTVLVSLLFMIILIIIASLYLASMIKRKLKKETIEVEQVLQGNMLDLKKEIDAEFARLAKFEGKAAYKKEKTASRKSIDEKLEMAEKKIMKEIKDVEKMLD
jgi:hypothetical protein